MGLTNRKILLALRNSLKKKQKIIQHLAQSSQNALSELQGILELKVIKEKETNLIRFK